MNKWIWYIITYGVSGAPLDSYLYLESEEAHRAFKAGSEAVEEYAVFGNEIYNFHLEIDSVEINPLEWKNIKALKRKPYDHPRIK